MICAFPLIGLRNGSDETTKFIKLRRQSVIKHSIGEYSDGIVFSTTTTCMLSETGMA